MRLARLCAMFQVRAYSQPSTRATLAIAALRLPVQSLGASAQIISRAWACGLFATPCAGGPSCCGAWETGITGNRSAQSSAIWSRGLKKVRARPGEETRPQGARPYTGRKASLNATARGARVEADPGRLTRPG